jgi:hypothetical protein
MQLATALHIKPRFRMDGATPPVSHACTRSNLQFTFCALRVVFVIIAYDFQTKYKENNRDRLIWLKFRLLLKILKK